ncbi:MAG: AEC family transporter [Rhodanobacteraceae bacterium]
MSALLLLFACLALGMLVRRFASPPDTMAHSINWWVLYVALPAIVLELIPRIHFDSQLWFPIAGTWVLFAGSWLLFAWLGRLLGWSRGRIGALTIVCGLGNTTFMGYPLIEALHGREGLKIAVVADQLGSFPILASLAILVASVYAGHATDARQIARRVLTFPAFLALLVGLLVNVLGGWPQAIHDMLKPVGATLTPLALFSVGLQLQLGAVRRHIGPMAVGLGWKLLLAPLLVWLLGRATGIDGLILVVGVLQSAMAPMVSAAIVADEYDLEPELANSVLGVGILISLITIPLADALLRMQPG